MRKLLAIAVLTALWAAPASAEISWSGGVGWRHRIRNNDDGLNSRDEAGRDRSRETRKDHHIRADLKAAETNEMLDWGVGVRTYGSATSEWLTLQNSSDLSLTLEQAYLRYHRPLGSVDFALTAGRQKHVLHHDSIGQALFDKDNRWDGFGWSFGFDHFGFNAAQYYLGARSSGAFGATTYSKTDATEAVSTTQGGFGVLLSAQPYLKLKVSEEMEALFAIGYHVWSGTQGNGPTPAYSNAIHGGTAAPTTGANLAGDNRDALIMDNSRQLHLLMDWSLPMKLRFVGEYVLNKKVRYGTFATPTPREAQRAALGLTLAYGKVKKPRDFALSYSYVRKGLGSVIRAYTHSRHAPDNIGHLFDGRFAVAGGVTLGAKVELYREKARLGGDGLALTGAGANRRQAQDRYEVTADLEF